MPAKPQTGGSGKKPLPRKVVQKLKPKRGVALPKPKKGFSRG